MQSTRSVGIMVAIALVAAVSARPAAADNEAALARAEAAYELGDYKAAAEIWLPLSDIGSARAQAWAGRLYQYGWGVAEDRARAHELFKRSAARGNSIALYYLAELYAEGRSGAPEPELAERAYREAAARLLVDAEGANWRAQGILGSMYYEGIGVNADPAVAERLFKAAARPSTASSQTSVGGALVSGILNPDSAPAALHVYDLAPGGNRAPVDRAMLGAATDCGCRAAKRLRTGAAAAAAGAFKEAHRLWLPLAEAGYSDAQFAIGQLHRSGLGVARSSPRAREWYEAADAQGYPGAGEQLATLDQ